MSLRFPAKPVRRPVSSPARAPRLSGRPELVEANRLAVAGLLGATAVAGLLFAPVFGPAALLLPVLLVVLLGHGCVEACARWPVLVPWRPLLIVVAGLFGLFESVLFSTTVAGLPTGSTYQVLGRGLAEGWQLTLQSTWPARPEPEQLLFVPLAVLLATVLGVELLLGVRKPLVALLPSLAVVGLTQAYSSLTGFTAVLAGLAYAAPVGLLLWAHRPSRVGARAVRAPGGLRAAARPSLAHVWLVVPTLLAVAVGAVALGSLDPAGRDAFSLKDGQVAPLRQNRTSNPLQEIAQRLNDRDREVFRYRSDEPVDRWSLVVLDGYDGVNWSAGARLRRLGQELAAPPGGIVRSADIQVHGLTGPWLPSQSTPVGVAGLGPLIDESTGTLVLDQPVTAGQARDYRLSWAVPDVDGAKLGVAPVDTKAGGLGGVGAVPPEIEELANEAVLGLRPTFQSALQLDRYLSTNYQVATGTNLPTGHSWHALQQFLLETRSGTSEQFAAAYVVLARISGIPARLVVGYRGAAEPSSGDYVVRNRDVLAWPEVAVAGVGWVPLDPTSSATEVNTTTQTPSGLSKAVEQAREQLPPEDQLRPPELPKQQRGEAGAGGGPSSFWLVASAAALVLLLLAWLVGVPLAKAVRARQRRRRTGTDGVIGAWAEARDRLRAHGVPYRIGMTPRDLAEAASAVTGEPTREPIVRLGRVLDMALWSGVPVGSSAARRAWDEVRSVRKGLAGCPFGTRLRAAVDPRTLFPPAGRTRGQP